MNKLPYQQALDRIHTQYIEMPGLRLTVDQVQRLCGVDGAVCRVVLEDLVRAKFLHQQGDGSYARVLAGVTTRFSVSPAARTSPASVDGQSAP